MDFAPPVQTMILGIVGALALLGIAWVWKLNRAMMTTPPDMLALSPKRWSDEEIRDTYRRIEAQSIDWKRHLPPKLDRRYVVTGGCGGVGGQMVLHLLERGQPPESIRIVDFRPPNRPDMLKGGPVRRVDFAQADVTSPAACAAAFAKPWPAGVAHLPLTVFHTVGLMSAGPRSLWTYGALERVNVGGTRNVLEAARAAGAGVFVSTSSGSVALRPVEFWGSNPFRRGWWPKYVSQVLDESDFDRPLRPHARFWSNYAHSKAVAERLVCGANTPAFRTGCIRPANSIYGSSQNDVVVGFALRMGTFPTWLPSILQNFVHGANVSLGHLLFEAALLRDEKTVPKCAGRPFVVTDGGPPPLFHDFYQLVRLTARWPAIRVLYVPPAVMLVLSHIVELFDIASSLPLLRWVVPKPRGDLAMLQPAVFSVGSHTPASDAAAQRSVDEGGLGYRPVYTTIEGMCQQVAEWNREHVAEAAAAAAAKPQSTGETLVKDVKNVGAAPASVSG